jgi:hypothetical protein
MKAILSPGQYQKLKMVPQQAIGGYFEATAADNSREMQQLTGEGHCPARFRQLFVDKRRASLAACSVNWLS